MCVVRGIHEAARKVVPRPAGAIHFAVVADAPSCAVLMETMVDDVSWYGGRRETDGCPGVVARVHLQLVLPALDAEPSCIDCSAYPARFDVFVVHVPGGLCEFPLIGSVEALLAVVTNVRALVVCVSCSLVSVMMGGERTTILFVSRPRLLYS